MTTRANRANLQPKGTPHAPAKAAPKTPSKAPSKPASKPASKQLTKPTPPSATKAHQAAAKAHQTATTRTPNATAQATGKAAGAGLKEAIDRRGAAAVLGSPAPAAPSPVTAASVTAKLEAAQPSGPLGLTPGDIREAQRDPRNQRALTPEQKALTQMREPAKGLTIPSEADVQAAAQNTHTPLIAVKRMSTAERRYAKSRIDDVIHAKNVTFKREREKLNRWDMVRDLFTKALASGRFSVDMNKVARANTDTNVIDVVKLDDYPQGLGKHVQSLYDALDARQEAMKLEGARMLDEIMLGSPADAIERIQHFENTKF